MTTLLFYIIFTSLSSFSYNEMSAIHSQLLRNSHSAKEVQRLTQLFSNYLDRVNSCESELKLRVVPFSCYEVLWLNKKFASTKTFPVKYETLDLLCKERAPLIKVSSSLELSQMNKEWVSSSCKGFLQKQKLRLRYIESESKPESIFFK